MHFLWPIVAPTSWYSFLWINKLLKVFKEAKIEAPIQTAFFLPLSLMTLTFACFGAKIYNSFVNLSENPSKSVEPPDKITLLYLYLLIYFTNAFLHLYDIF